MMYSDSLCVSGMVCAQCVYVFRVHVRVHMRVYVHVCMSVLIVQCCVVTLFVPSQGEHAK